MSRFLTFVMLLIGLAVVQAVAVALVAGLLLALLFCFATRPREALLYLGSLALLGLASARPVALIVALAVIGVALMLARGRGRWGRSRFAGAGCARRHRTPRLDGDVSR